MTTEILIHPDPKRHFLTTFAQQQLETALGRFGHRIRHLRLRLADANGPRGGLDQECLVEVTLRPRGSAVVSVRDIEPEAAISRAADRVARRVRDALERKRDLRRGAGQPRLPAA